MKDIEMRSILLMTVLLAVAGCSNFAVFGPRDQAPRAEAGVEAALSVPAEETDGDVEDPDAVPGSEAPPPSPSARTVEQFDTTTEADREAASAAPAPEEAAGERLLGSTIASLGDPTDPGFWAETPLVSEVTQGRLEFPETGKSVTVELRPSGGEAGSGSRVSLPALRVLEAPLTALPELKVFAL